jgi:hypothetical protein
MSSTTVESLEAANNLNILKFSVGAAIFGDIDAATISDIFNTDGTLATLPDGYYSAGLINTDGITLNRNLTVQEVMSWQSVESQRTDVTQDTLQIQIKFQESLNPAVLAIQEAKKIADVITSMEGANHFSFDKDPSGVQPQRRCLLIGHDTLRDVIVARYLPRVAVNAYGAMAMQRGTEQLNDVTFDCYLDPTYTGSTTPNGTSSRYFIGGPGLPAIVGTDPAVPTPPAWAATHVYALNALVTLTGKVLKATTAGTSGSTAPTVPGTIGGAVTDGTVTWTRTE